MVSRLSGGTRDALKAAAILGSVILLLFGDVSFLGYTLSPAAWTYGVLVPPYGYQGRWLHSATVMDPLASGGVSWPIFELISRTVLSGQLPLWNPYQGTGAPLAADTSWSTYFPVNILYVLPNQYWDFVWLFKIWLAGIVCYLFLKKLGLAHVSATGGSLAYCLSGAFIFYPFLPWTNVAILTPALLLVVKKCFDESPAWRTIGLGSVVFAVSLLGAHIEALVIQFIFVGLFVTFEGITRKNERSRGVATWVASVTLGFGLAAFFLLPVFEYLGEAALAHGAGLHSLSNIGNPVIWWVTLFVPYFYGFLQTYPYEGLRQVFYWDYSPGYIGATVFFLSLVPLFSVRRAWRSRSGRYLVFFFAGVILALMEIFGIAPVNWIGSLPVMQYIVFPRYLGSVLAISFAGACAFGLENIAGRDTSSVMKALLVALAAIGPGVYVTVPFPASPNNPFFAVSMGYLAFSIFLVTLSSLVVSKGGDAATKALVGLIVLELAAYIPRSLPVLYEAVRVAILAAAGLILVAIVMRPRHFVALGGSVSCPFSFSTLLSRRHTLAVVVIAALVLQFAVAGASPQGLPSRCDPYAEAPYLRFLEANVGYQRVYSLDGVFFSNVGGLFSIQNLGEFSAFMPSSFRKFSLANLDRGALTSHLSGNAWGRNAKYSVSSEISDNIEFYSLLGVKYFVTAYTDLSIAHQIALQPEIEGSHNWAPLGRDSVSTQFVTDESFDGILVRIGTYDRTNTGDIVLVLDSVPPDRAFHREARIDARSIVNGAHNLFRFARVNVQEATEFRVILSQADTQEGNEVAVMWWPQVEHNAHLRISDGFLNVALGLVLRDEYLSVAYQDQNATIYENRRVFPRAFLVRSVLVAANQDQAILWTRDLGWDTRNTAVVEGNLHAEFDPMRTSVADVPESVRIERYSTSEIAIGVETASSSLLVLTDTFYPGWNAYVDGAPRTIYRGYGVVRAVFLERGSHSVAFRYEPSSFRFGAILSSLAMAITLYLLFGRAVGREKRWRASVCRGKGAI